MSFMKKYAKTTLIILLALVMCTGILPMFNDTVPEAEAATAGLYDIKVEVTVTDGADGWDRNEHYVNHKSNNGTGTQTAQSVGLSTGNMDEEKTHTFTYTSKGFPTSYTYNYEFGGGLTWRSLAFTLKVYASKAGANSWKQVMSGSFSDESSAFNDASGTWTCTASTNIATPTSVSWSNGNKSITVPQSGTSTANTTSATVYDQYGVEWYQEPYYALNTGSSPATSSTTISGITRTTSQADTCTVSVTNAAKTWVDNGGGTSRDVYITAYLSNAKTTNTTKFTINQVQYSISFIDGYTTLQAVDCYYNKQPSYTGAIPTKAADAQYTYTFDGWTTSQDGSGTVYTASTLPVATGAAQYYAHYAKTVNKYDITFNNYDGTQLQYSEWDYGEMPQYNGDTPVRESDPPYKFTYVFSGWDPEIKSVTEDAIYTAYFQEILNKYEIKFVNDDGTVLQSGEVDADATPVYSGSTPTKAATAQYTYTFKGWDKEIVPVTGEATYTATYDATVNNYTVTWNIDGVTETETYSYGATPSHADPEKAADAQYTYTFAGWTPTVTTVTGNATYTANFNKTVNKYTVKFVDANGNTVSETKYDYGTAASAVVKPANTEKHYDATNHYTYAWPTVAEVTGDAVYTEKQTATAHTLSEYSRNDATCTATGTSYLECSCGYRTTEVLSIIAHTIIDVAQVDAKCEVPGVKAHYKCSVCGALFSDAEATKPTTAAELTIAALEHNYKETITAATCTKGAYSTFTCSLCGDTYDTEPGEPLAHPYELVKEDPAATCTANGTAYYECPVCGAEKAETVAALGHDAELVAYKDSTCTAEGNIEHYFCSRCNNAFSDEACSDLLNSVTIAKKDHTWSDWAETLAPTCSAEGKETKSCSVCGTSEERAKSIDPDAHKWSSFEHIDNSTTHTCVCEYNENHRQNADCTYSDYTIVNNATCTDDGEKFRTCLDCEHKYTETITALGHTPGAAATCTEDQTCTVCGEVLAEKLGHTPGAAATCTEDQTCTVCGEVLTEKLGHTPGAAATCTEDQTCTVCGEVLAEKLGHNPGAEATCTDDQTCTVCGEVLAEKLGHTPGAAATCTDDQTCTVCGEVLAEKLGHTPGAEATCTEDQTCTVCGEVLAEKLGHTPGAEATCTEDQTCTVCGEVLTEKLGHKYDSVVTDPTCTDDGYTTYTCSACGDTYTADEVAALGHKWGAWNVITAATCTTAGEDRRDCTVCDAYETVVTNALNHLEVSHEAKAPTCTEPGWDAYVTCSRCDYTTKVEKAALGHTEEIDAAVAPTCTETGLTEGKHCSVCDEVLVAQTVVDTLGHDYVGVETKAPTCTETGVMTYTCQNDASHTYTEEIPMIEHDWAEADCTKPSTCKSCGAESGTAIGHSYTRVVETVAKTCTTDGYTVYGCVRCDATETRDIVAASHTLTSVDAQLATCEGIGWDAYEYCSECDYTTYKAIAATGHDMQETTAKVDATCEAAGKEAVYTCANNCGKTEGGEEIAALGHDMKETVAKVEATCEAAGKEAVYTCANGCGKTEGGEEIAALGHDYVGVETKAPTCTETGVMTYTCQNDASHTYTEDIDMIEHDWAEADCTKPSTCKSCGAESGTAIGHSYTRVVETVAKTCTTDGYTVYGCVRCDATEIRDIVAASHTLTSVDAQPATCEETGWDAYEYCSECDYTTYVEIPATDHNYVGVVTTEPTCLTAGVKTFTCQNDENHTYTEAVAALGHNEITHDAKAPTCTESGWDAYVTCSRCDYTTKVEKVALGHTEETIPAVDATCTEKGLTAGVKCSVCGEIITAQEEIKALGHAEETIPAVDATCTEKGLTAGVKCSVCGETITAQEEVKALGHAPAEAVIENEVAATCETAGAYDKVVYCSVCDEELDRDTVSVPATDHAYQLRDLVRPSRQADGTWGNGYETHVCENDSRHVKTIVVERADYTEYDDAFADLEARLEDATLSEEVRKQIEKLLEENTVAENLIVSEQDAVNNAADTIAAAGQTYLQTYTVTFVSDGTVLSEQTVYYGAAATAPTNPTKDGYTFIGWDRTFENIKVDTTVTAVYKEGNLFVEVEAESICVAVGATKQIIAAVLPEESADATEMTWSIADSSIAKIDANGMVTGIKNGITTATVSIANGTISKTVTVYVYKTNGDYTVQLAKSPYGNFVIGDYIFYETAYINVKPGEQFRFRFALNSKYSADDIIIVVNGQEISVDGDNYFTVPYATDNLTILAVPAPGSDLPSVDNDDNNGTNNTAHSCWCHSSNKLLQFIWKIIMFFCKLFGIEKYHYCECGVAHW